MSRVDDSEETAWMERGRCRGANPVLFFPERGGDFDTPKRICAECPVIAECREYALRRPVSDGVWGGMSERERKRLRRRARLDALA